MQIVQGLYDCDTELPVCSDRARIERSCMPLKDYHNLKRYELGYRLGIALRWMLEAAKEEK